MLNITYQDGECDVDATGMDCCALLAFVVQVLDLWVQYHNNGTQ